MSKVSAQVIILVIWVASMTLGSPCLLYSTTITYKYSGKIRTACILVWPDGQPMVSTLDYAENAAEVEESGTTQRLLECDTEECNGYMHTVLCTNPAQHDRMASFFLCNDKCEIYQQRKRKLEKRMTTPTVPVPEQYLDPERADVDEVDVPEQDTQPMDEDATSISHDGVPLSEQDTMLIGDDNGSAHASFDPVEVDEGVNWHCTQELQPPKSVKSRRRRVRKNKRKNETVQRRQNRSCKRRILSDGHVVFLFIEEEPQQLTMQNGESQPSA